MKRSGMLSAGLVAAALGFVSSAQADHYSTEPSAVPPPPARCPPNQYGVQAVIWHHPQPLVNHGIPATYRASPNFAFDRSNINASAAAELDALVTRVHGLNSDYGLGRRGIARSVNIVGHTDYIDTVAYNQRLSERRANSTANYLMTHGIHPDRFSISGASELQPVASNRTAAGRAENRRADVTVHALIAP